MANWIKQAWFEANITIGGVKLNAAQAMAIRVAVATFAMELDDPGYRAELGEIGTLYQARVHEVIRAMHQSILAQEKKAAEA